MPSTPVVFSDSGFPANFTGTPQAFKDAFIQYLTATVSTNNILTGKLGGSAPTSDIGPWLTDTGVWKHWNGSSYVPVLLVVAGNTGNATLQATLLTADRTITFPDKDGTVALISDVYGSRATQVLTGTPITLDWSLASSFYLTLSANTTIKQVNSIAGQEIYVAINNPSTYTVTWDAQFQFNAGSDPTQTTNGTDLYIIKNVGGNTFARRAGANFS